MRITIIFLFQFMFLIPLWSQGKEDYVWKLGYGVDDTIFAFGGVELDFHHTPLLVSKFSIPFDLITGVSEVNSPDGIPLFYSNCCAIANAENLIMDNGHQINPGSFHGYQCGSDDWNGYLTHQGAVTVEWPGHSGKYMMFHLGYEAYPSFSQLSIRDLYYTEIDMTDNNGLGKVASKNNLLLYDQLLDNISAVRHGNGRDWWIIQPKNFSDTVYTFLLDPSGIHGPFAQKTDLPVNMYYGFTSGQALFSPNGAVYVRESAGYGIDIFKFNRCSGDLYDGQRLSYPGTTSSSFSGASMSPSSRLLYISVTNQLFQYDLTSTDIEASKVLIDNYDGFIDTTKSGQNLRTYFYQMQLAPNGSIYMSCPSGLKYLHVIHAPDSVGLACNFKQHDLNTPNHLGACLPNFPNFRLRNLPGSVCDSIVTDMVQQTSVQKSIFGLYPNPVEMGGMFHLKILPHLSGLVRIFNLQGMLIKEFTIQPSSDVYSISCSGLQPNVYFVSISGIRDENLHVAAILKLVVLK